MAKKDIYGLYYQLDGLVYDVVANEREWYDYYPGLGAKLYGELLSLDACKTLSLIGSFFSNYDRNDPNAPMPNPKWADFLTSHINAIKKNKEVYAKKLVEQLAVLDSFSQMRSKTDVVESPEESVDTPKPKPKPKKKVKPQPKKKATPQVSVWTKNHPHLTAIIIALVIGVIGAGVSIFLGSYGWTIVQIPLSITIFISLSIMVITVLDLNLREQKGWKGWGLLILSVLALTSFVLTLTIKSNFAFLSYFLIATTIVSSIVGIVIGNNVSYMKYFESITPLVLWFVAIMVLACANILASIGVVNSWHVVGTSFIISVPAVAICVLANFAMCIKADDEDNMNAISLSVDAVVLVVNFALQIINLSLGGALNYSVCFYFIGGYSILSTVILSIIRQGEYMFDFDEEISILGLIEIAIAILGYFILLNIELGWLSIAEMIIIAIWLPLVIIISKVSEDDYEMSVYGWLSSITAIAASICAFIPQIAIGALIVLFMNVIYSLVGAIRCFAEEEPESAVMPIIALILTGVMILTYFGVGSCASCM